MTGPSVFISYSHKDEDWKDRLVTHLGVLEQVGVLDLWEDRRIEAGDDWKLEIEDAIKKASVAILMITANFLTSKFILNAEVPKLLERQKKEGLRIIPIIVRPCAWTRVKWLSNMQARPKDGKPLSGGNENQIDIDLVAIADEIARLVEHAESESTKKYPAMILPGISSDLRIPPKPPRNMSLNSSSSVSKGREYHYKEYSKDIWDYISDMPYLPSRTDRDKLVKNGGKNGALVWDYFFRIRPEDVGKPHQSEINNLKWLLEKDNLQDEQKSNYLQRIHALEIELNELKKQIPILPQHSVIRNLLNDKFVDLYEKSIEITGLANRLIDINSLGLSNPIPFLVPAELQQPELLRRSFFKTNSISTSRKRKTGLM